MLTTPVVLLLLLLVFGGLIAAGLPLLIAVAGVAGTFGVLYRVQPGRPTCPSTRSRSRRCSSVGLAVDYGLLMVSRFREERAVDPDVSGPPCRGPSAHGRAHRRCSPG